MTTGISFPIPEYVTGQPVDAVAVTPSDTVRVPNRCRGVFVGTGGNITVVTADADREFSIKGTAIVPVLFKNMPSGSFLGLHIVKVMATGTTANDIVAFI